MVMIDDDDNNNNNNNLNKNKLLLTTKLSIKTYLQLISLKKRNYSVKALIGNLFIGSCLFRLKK